MTDKRLVSTADLESALETMLPGLVRYPGLDATAFEQKVRRFIADERT